MNFERGKDPKHSMEIGLWANAIHIETILEDKAKEDRSQGETWMYTFSKEQISKKKTHLFLTLLSNQRSIDPIILNGKYPSAGPPAKNLISWKTLEGKHIIYDNKLYRIPKFIEHWEPTKITVI